MQIGSTQNLNSSPAQSQPPAAIKKAATPLVPPQQEFIKLSQQAEQLAEQNQRQSQTDSVKVSASTGQSQAQGSLTEQQAIALYRKIASLL
ncbi:hypothetical protein [Motilimonas eburnea]|uniref:hypothetical protein n=1 Tax=Motilimonas eburnea TaxID=1737488 RepID=UPI001E2E1818|nr:hypothetical protein [Motilimonas eburnea]MCE2571074.1 hypothetical protein [Motilimonas eburnea]